MNTTTFSLVIGIAFTLAGILGLFPAALTPPPADAPALSFNVLHGYLLGLFAVNVLNSAVHIAFGIAGLASATSEYRARLYARGLAVLCGGFGIMGMLPTLNTTFGLMPLHGNDVWANLGAAAIAGYFGWRAEIPVLSNVDDRREGLADRRHALTRVAHERRGGAYDRRMPLGT
jgi:hypothetical protein